MKDELETECASKLTEKTTLPPVIIKDFNLCEKKNSYFLGSKGLTRDYLPYNSTVWDLKQRLTLCEIVVSFSSSSLKGLELLIES